MAVANFAIPVILLTVPAYMTYRVLAGLPGSSLRRCSDASKSVSTSSCYRKSQTIG